MAAKIAEKLSIEEVRELRDLLDGDAYDHFLDALDAHLPEEHLGLVEEEIAGSRDPAI